MKVAEEGLLVTREREEADGYGNTDVNADLTAVCVACELTCEIARLSVDNRAVCIRIVVHYFETFLKVLATFDAKNGSEHFISADSHILCNLVKNCRSDEIAVFIAFNDTVSAVEYKLSALGYALVNVGDNLLVVLFICNRSEL